MPRTHPPTLLVLAARTVRDEKLFARGDRVLAAVSGGPDSMALLHVLAGMRGRLGFSLVAHGVDHGLREGASAELDGAEALARSLEVEFGRTKVALEPGGNLQARARTARYEALRAAAARYSAPLIATAHHREDRAETVLLRLLRGAGPRGLAVLPSRAGDLVRPFIHAPRAAIDAHLRRHDVPFAVDPSNRDPRFLRVRVRHELLPLLRSLSPGIDDHLCALADQLLPSMESTPSASPVAAGTGAREVAALAGVDPLALGRASRQALAALGANRSRKARVSLKGGLVARWDAVSGSVIVSPAQTEEAGHRRDRPRKDK